MSKLLIKKILNKKKLFFVRSLIIFFFLISFLLILFPYFLKNLHFPDAYPFLDLKGRLAHLEAHRLGIDTYISGNPLDPFNRANNKPSITLSLKFLNLKVDDSIWLGSFLVSFFLIQSVSLLRRSNIIFLILGAGCIFNPNVILAVERCNDDIIIFLFCFGIPYLISKDYIRNIFPILIIWALSAMKYYPIFLYLIFFQKKIKKTYKYIISILFINTFWFVIHKEELLYLKSRIPSPSINLFTFGIKEVIFLFKDNNLGIFNLISKELIFILIFLFTATIIYLILNKEFNIINEQLSKIKNIDKEYFLIGTLLILFSYLLNTNWSYRLIHSIFLLPTTLKMLPENNIFNLKYRFQKVIFLILICLSFGSWVCILNNETALILKIAFNFIFFALTLSFGFFIFENLNDYKIRKFFEKKI